MIETKVSGDVDDSGSTVGTILSDSEKALIREERAIQVVCALVGSNKKYNRNRMCLEAFAIVDFIENLSILDKNEILSRIRDFGFMS